MKTNANIAFDCTYHVVWCPKYRLPALTETVGAYVENQRVA
jgi:REP element-mobilizing transposase RayT